MRDRVRPDAERRYFLPSNGGFGRAYCPDQPTPRAKRIREEKRHFGNRDVPRNLEAMELARLAHHTETYETEEANPIGKWIGSTCYAHIKSWEWLPVDFKHRISKSCGIAGLTLGDPWNVVKINLHAHRVSLLYYSDFWSDPFPPLCIACTVDLQAKTTRKRNYDPVVQSTDSPQKGIAPST